MIDMDVREYFIINKRGTILGVSEDLGEDEDEIAASFEYWKNRGKLRQLGGSLCSSCQSSCSTCESGTPNTVAYEWVDK